MQHIATYSPEDNKLRLFPACRLGTEDFEKVKKLGFRWAPRQELFVAPGWSPAREDLLTDLVRAEADGDRLSQQELIVLFTNIFGGAIESTASLISSGIFELARHPEQAAMLRADPERWKKGFAEETLRMRPGFYAVHKKATRRVEAFGLVFEPDEAITIPLGAPNRDPRRWTSPERFDLRRDPKRWPLTFSMGEHFCLGQALARCEIQEALASFVQHCDEIELENEPRWRPHVMVNRLESVPIRYRPRHAQ